MSISIVFRCDALDCSNEKEIEEALPFDGMSSPKGWGEFEDRDYCPSCWPEVAEENGLDND